MHQTWLHVAQLLEHFFMLIPPQLSGTERDITICSPIPIYMIWLMLASSQNYHGDKVQYEDARSPR